MSATSISDLDDPISSCFQFIPTKNDGESISSHSNPDSSFYLIKNTSTSTMTRSGNARTIFTVIPPMPQDTTNFPRVRRSRKRTKQFDHCFEAHQLIHTSFFMLLVNTKSFINQRWSSCE